MDDLSVVAALRTAIRHDDGVVVWLNGVEAFRDNVPAEERVTGNDELELVPREIDAALLVEGTNTLAAEVHQADDSTDASFGFRVALELADLLPETLVLGTGETSEEHVFPLYGLLPAATYRCVARSNACDGATAPATIRTDPLDLTVPPLALRRGAETPGAGAYTLFNHQRPCADEHGNRLFVVDPEGRVRWYEELPIDAPSSIDIEAVWQPDDGTFLWGGGDQVGIPPQEVALDGTVRWVASYPGIEQEEYHHDIEVLPNGRILGLIDSSVSDGADDWAGIGLVEHDPATGEVTWRWTADEAWANGELSPVEPGEGDPWHPNSLAYVSDEDGEGIYVSLLYSNEIIRIDRTTGHVLYSLGVEGDFVLTEGTWFDHLHAIDVGPDGRLFVYDNGWAAEQSRALAFELDLANRTARLDFAYTEPGWYERTWGDADPIGDDLVLVNMAHAVCQGATRDHMGALADVRETTGEVVWRLDFLDPYDSSYRAQRLDACFFPNARYCVAD